MRKFVGSLECANLWVPLNARICRFLWLYGSIELATLWVLLSAPTCGLPSMHRSVGSLECTVGSLTGRHGGIPTVAGVLTWGSFTMRPHSHPMQACHVCGACEYRHHHGSVGCCGLE